MAKQPRTKLDDSNARAQKVAAAAALELAAAQKEVAAAFDIAIAEVEQYDISIFKAVTGTQAVAAQMLRFAEANVAVAKTLTDAQDKVNRAAGIAPAILTEAQLKAAAWTKKVTEAQQELIGTFERGKNALLGWATAGLAGTTTGERLGFQMSMLRREISSLFLPALEQVSKWIDQLTQRFRLLTGEQQANIGRWLLGGVAALGFATVLTRVASAIGGLLTSIKTLMMVNPFLAAAVGLGLLMAQTEQGRTALSDMGRAAMDAFGSIAEALSGPLGAALEVVSNFFSSNIGKIALWGMVFLAAIRAVQTAFARLALTFVGALGIVGLIGGALALLTLGLGKSSEGYKDLADAVRRGQLTPEKAKEEAKARAEDEFAEKKRKVLELEEWEAAHPRAIRRRGWDAASMREALEAEMGQTIEQSNKQIDFASRGKGRNELLLSQTGQESPQQTINRITSAALKTDDTKRSADGIEALLDLFRSVLPNFMREDKDNRDKPRNED